MTAGSCCWPEDGLEVAGAGVFSENRQECRHRRTCVRSDAAKEQNRQRTHIGVLALQGFCQDGKDVGSRPGSPQGIKARIVELWIVLFDQGDQSGNGRVKIQRNSSQDIGRPQAELWLTDRSMPRQSRAAHLCRRSRRTPGQLPLSTWSRRTRDPRIGRGWLPNRFTRPGGSRAWNCWSPTC